MDFRAKIITGTHENIRYPNTHALRLAGCQISDESGIRHPYSQALLPIRIKIIWYRKPSPGVISSC